MTEPTSMELGKNTVANFTDLSETLRIRGVPFLFDPDRKVIETPIDQPPLQSKLYLRWEDKAPVLQLIVIMSENVPLKRLHELEVACCHANTAIALPGFGIDYTNHNVYNRLTLPTVGGIPVVTLDRMMMSVVTNARDFLPAFNAVISGQNGADIIASALATRPAPMHA